MPASPLASVEAPVIAPRRRSRRIWLVAIIGIAVLAIGWLSFIALDRRVRSEQVAQYNERMRLASTAEVNGQTFAYTPRMASNLNYTPATQSLSLIHI
mgnify:CR=1 FL=1